MPITWDYFTKRFGIDTKAFIEKHNCKSYNDLCDILNHDDVTPPPETEVKSFFTAQQAVENEHKAQAVKKPVKKQQSRKKPAQKKQSLGTKSSAEGLSRHQIRKRAQTKTTEKKSE